MSKRRHYSPEYKRELVELVRRSRPSCRQIALEVGINPNMLTRWVREANAGGGKAFPAAACPATRRWPASSASCRRSPGNAIF